MYCGNNPVTYSDMEGTSAAAALAIAGGSSLVPGFGWVIGGIILVGVAVVAGVAAGEATRNNIQDAPKSSLKTKTLADVKAKIPRQPVYQLAYISIYDNLVRLPKYYTFYQILILLDVYRLAESVYACVYDSERSSDLQKQLENKGKAWGVYTQNQNNAKGLAYMLVCQEPPEVHGSGMYGHYNISNKKGKHVFHIWFGSILNY